MCPWASAINVQGVAVFFGGEVGGRGGGDEVSELGGFAAELAVGVGVLVDGGLESWLAAVGLIWGWMFRTFSGMLRR